ncbi:Gfo/Idh/MocA family oxidoreductase [Streptosporangium sp. NBC_01810]|uniref:Gfo/Idh/MocA family oxidoreductase n=1 Tax=Streptosporangium sp. NBC_01810 TaxID=2975951 RepID=UPI002DDB6F7B|nr:Gfo/Idh/MocA family oxidoreductase [Streptosporangium sp. NBC_01810]WSA28624.1 Gfo/Idh/MocA family oxidoreductase [Streptosporangium sp. NBC_01810]
MNGHPPLRMVVCGTNFGRFYAEAVLAHPGYTLAAILSRGSAASRAYARRLGVPHHTEVDQLPDDLDTACVVVGSSISGGEGTALAKALIGRGLHVLQEHPVHLDELTECLKLARRHRVQYRLNTHYPHVEPVRAFIQAARRLTTRQKPLFIDAATPVHLMQPMVDILGRALGSLRPWRFTDPLTLPAEVGTQPFRLLQGVLGGVALTVRVHHQLDPADRDNHALHWHRVSLGTEGGVLTLADTHGPLLWSPRLHVNRDADRRFVLDGPGTDDLDLTTTSVIGDTGTFREVFTELWPQAVGRALDGLRAAVTDSEDVLRAAQYDLTMCRIWSDLAARLGPPEIIRPPAPHPLPAGELFPAPPAPAEARKPIPSPEPPTDTGSRPAPPSESSADTEAAPPYTPSAEFFDLIATEHTAGASAPAVARALAGADLSHGPVLDIGAGTGLLTEAVARARPDAEILACEPATGMRAVLTSRVFSDPYLRPRVTITADAAPELELPDHVSAVLLCGVLGHLDAGQRRRLWERLLRRLSPKGVVIVELMGMEKPLLLPETRMATARAGHHRYEWWFSGAPDQDAPATMRLHTTWRVYLDDEDIPLRLVHDSYRWIPFGLRQVAEEAGLHARLLPTRPGAPPLAELTRQPVVASPVPTPGPALP